MDLFVQNIPPAATRKHIEGIFHGPLAAFGIPIFHAEKLGQGPLASITILDVSAGMQFLAEYGTPARGKRAPRSIHWGGKYLNISQSRNAPSDLALQSLREKRAIVPSMTDVVHRRIAQNSETTCFEGGQLECGKWDYVNGQLTFISHFQDSREGIITIGRKQAIFMLGAPGTDKHRIDINYHDCEDIVIDDTSIIVNLRFAPKIFLIKSQGGLIEMLQTLNIGNNKKQVGSPKKIRVPAINIFHNKVTGACWTYRIELDNPADTRRIRNLLSRNGRMCSIHLFKAKIQAAKKRFEDESLSLHIKLTMVEHFGCKPFPLRFQLDRLARNGFLPPGKVLSLLPTVSALYNTYGLHPILSALRQMTLEMPFAGPNTLSRDFSIGFLEETLESKCASYDPSAPNNPYLMANRHIHINLIHKMVVCPSGVRLEGPEPEPTNRVLRTYADNTDSFVRVEFRDDDGAPVRHDARTEMSLIYHERFKSVLDGTTLVCGFAYSFLGFSHSSLRSQSCWFMHPFVDSTGKLILAEMLLKRLGDFESIRTPAKCAARIGQNFTDTNASIDILPSELHNLPLVTRNGHDFGDGVGTISLELLQAVHRVYGTKRMLKPKALQIRFQGAKGMVALDSRLKGKKLCLRSNMIKFPTKSTWNLEICGAAFKPLPMVLNRQFIKLFEDLGIESRVFMHLQNRFKDTLTQMTTSAVNTANWLETIECSGATRLPSLVRYIGQIGLDYRADPFLYSIVEMAVVAKLRDVKYKGRIPVEKGMTLYGIMDETGYLKEREIYVVTEKAPMGGRRILIQQRVVVTRSPALYPGDIQIVSAVDVPEDSPLAQLRNVVVFSQHGSRDIPSMLSGGDLDGDLYNIIWDKDLLPAYGFAPADYPRVPPLELDRVVSIKDMSDFFVTFMENDRLGSISNAHMIVADQKQDGTLNPDALKLSRMASTAVDFSKTGIAMTEQMPKYPHFRPDFMAPSPRVYISPAGFLDFEDTDEEEDDAFDGIDSEKPAFRYYTSVKALGQLYRNIDERQFIFQMQYKQKQISAAGQGGTLMRSLLNYAQHWAKQYGVIYTHHKAFARQIRQSYDESLLTILHDYEPTPHSPLSETEAFAGHIVGRHSGVQDKPLKDLAKVMRERFSTVVEHAVMRIVKGDEAMREVEDLDDLYDAHYDERELEALPRSLAALEVAVLEGGGGLKSFGYVALGVVLRELDRYRITTFGSLSGLPRGLPSV